MPAQTDNASTGSAPPPRAARQPLQSLAQVTSTDDIITFGGIPGRTDGLEGVVYRFDDIRSDYDCSGYLRWYVILRRVDGKPFPRDEHLSMKFLAMFSGYEPEIVHGIELRQGALESRSSFLAPAYPCQMQTYQQRSISSKLFSEGRELRGLTTISSGYFNSGSQKNTPQKGTKIVRLGQLSSFKVGFDKNHVSQLKLLESREGWILPELDLALLSHLPSDWRELAATPCFAIKVDDLLSSTQEQSTVLCKFVAAGGQLIIVDCPSPPDMPEEVERWIESFVLGGTRQASNWTIKRETKTNRCASYLSVGFGHFVLFDGKLYNKVPNEALSVAIHRPSRMNRLFNVDLMDWTIPKLGQPPVIAFFLSICAFAILAGPVLLWWTNVKQKRPVLLLLLFPLSAMLITASIFAFALLHDGWGTSSRIRSLTWVDNTTGLGCAYSRQTYFSGFPPSSVEFSSASEVWEVPSPNATRNNYPGYEPHSEVKRREFADKQSYVGLFTAREQKQWMVTTPVDGLKPFEWEQTEQSEQSELPRVRNLLAENWRVAVFVDSEKRVYIAEQVGSKGSIELTATTAEDARDKVMGCVVLPAYPPNYSSADSYNLFGWFGNYSRLNTSRVSIGKHGGNHIESSGEEFLQDLGKKGRQFLIVLERAEHLDRPFTSGVYESDSSHMMMGTW
ncbi:MAG: hypothetical protein SGI77_18970 [Pirellulaceae bacterium]|nr:hypothetical protein [Pirellulaceae bacterium]